MPDDERKLINIGINIATKLDDVEYDLQKKDIAAAIGLSVSALNTERKRLIKEATVEKRDSSKMFTDKTEPFFKFFRYGGQAIPVSMCVVSPQALEEFEFVMTKTWDEFIRVTSNFVHLYQAFLQVVAAGWPVKKFFEFKIAYRHVFKQYLQDIMQKRTKPSQHVFWPTRADAAAPHLCKLKIYTAGQGRMLNRVFNLVKEKRESDFHVAMAAGYRLEPGYYLENEFHPPKIERDRKWKWPLITGDLAPGYREIIPSRGLLVHGSKDPKRLNTPYIEKDDMGDWLSPVRTSVYRPGETRHEYIKGRFNINSIKKNMVPAAELMSDYVSSIDKITGSFPGLPVDALGYQICRGMLNEIDESVSQAFLFMVGTSGSGKTQVTRLAGEILGSETCVITISDDMRDSIQRLGYAFKNKERFICLDEFHLLYQATKMKDRTKITRILQSLSRRYRFDAKYQDDETVDSHSVVVMTGTSVPSDFASKQLGRRTLKYELPELPNDVDWKISSGGIIGWRCRNKENKYNSDLITSRAFDLLCHPDIDFNHIYVEKLFNIHRLNVIANPDIEARHNAYATLYKIWKHSYIAQLNTVTLDEQKSSDLNEAVNMEWGDSRWMHDVALKGTDGWLNLRHPTLSSLMIIESIFPNLDVDAHPRQVEANFRREEGEESFLRLFGFTFGHKLELMVRRKGAKLCAKFIFWKDEGRGRGDNLPPHLCPDLDDKWELVMFKPPAMEDRYIPESSSGEDYHPDDDPDWTKS